MSYSQSHSRLPLHNFWHQDTWPSSSYCDQSTETARNHNNVNDLMRKFEGIFHENASNLAESCKRARTTDASSGIYHGHPSCSWEAQGRQYSHYRNTSVDHFEEKRPDHFPLPPFSRISVVQNDANHYVPPPIKGSFMRTEPSEYVEASCSQLFEPRRHEDRNGSITYAKSDSEEFSTSSHQRDSADTFMSKDEIDRCSPSRKDGIDPAQEKYLRYSYCTYIQKLGLMLELPQTTIGTAMILCHRFYFRRSHASDDRFLIATAALFLSAKSEETPRPLNDVLKIASELCHKHDLALHSFMLPIDWFDEYKERVLEAEQLILTTLDFELGVQHPYVSLTSVLDKLGLSRTVLLHVSWNVVTEGLRSSLWLQFKPNHIAAGAVFIAGKFLNLDLSSHEHLWEEFKTSRVILQDVVEQLMELF